jgi:hypothetical protein
MGFLDKFKETRRQQIARGHCAKCGVRLTFAQIRAQIGAADRMCAKCRLAETGLAEKEWAAQSKAKEQEAAAPVEAAKQETALTTRRKGQCAKCGVGLTFAQIFAESLWCATCRLAETGITESEWMAEIKAAKQEAQRQQKSDEGKICAKCGVRLSFFSSGAGERKCPKCQLMESGLTETEAAAQIEAAKQEAARNAQYRANANYVTGPWNIKGGTSGVVDRDEGNLTFTIGLFKKQTFTLPYNSIRKFSVSTVDQLPRVTATRLMLVGIFALAWKKGQKDKFLNIDFVDDTNTELPLVFAKAPGGPDMDTLQTKVITARSDYIKSKGLLDVASTANAHAPVSAGAGNIVAQIEELAKLRDKGILTPEEFEAKKSELLARL